MTDAMPESVFTIDRSGLRRVYRVKDGGRPRQMFAGTEADSAVFAQVLQAQQAFAKSWEGRQIREQVSSRLEGFRAAIYKEAGKPRAQLSIIRERMEVAQLVFGVSNPRCVYVLGQQTMDGQPFVVEGLRGKGLATWMYDAASEIAGRPMVPHSRNFAGGTQSELAVAFWSARARKREFPGREDTSEIVRRREVMTRSEAIVTAERVLGYEQAAGGAALVLAMQMPGARIEGTVILCRDGQRRLDAAWVLMPDGRRLCASGELSDEDLTALLMSKEAPDRDVGVFDVEEALCMEVTRYGGGDGFRMLAWSLAQDWRHTGVVARQNLGLELCTTVPADFENHLRQLANSKTERTLGS